MNRTPCGRRSTGRLYCWGSDANGGLGDQPVLANRPTPVQVSGNRTDWVGVAAGDRFTCARRSTSRLFCWGRDFRGALGNGGGLVDKPTPVQVAS